MHYKVSGGVNSLEALMMLLCYDIVPKSYGYFFAIATQVD